MEQESNTADKTTKPGDTKAAVEELGAKLQDAFTSMGSAAKDPAVKSDMEEIGVGLKDAMMQTFSAVGAHVDDAVKKKSGSNNQGSDTQNTTPNDSVDEEE